MGDLYRPLSKQPLDLMLMEVGEGEGGDIHPVNVHGVFSQQHLTLPSNHIHIYIYKDLAL